MGYMKCIGKVCLKDESQHIGTGFLIGKTKFITAKHVMDKNGVLDSDKQNIKVYFKEINEGIEVVNVEKVIRDENRDIVIFQLDKAMNEYLKVDIDDFCYEEEFFTFGYPARKKTNGEKIYGNVLIEEFKNNNEYDLDLHCPEFEGLNSSLFAGISGAPIITKEGYAKGLIIKKPNGTDSFAGLKLLKSIDFLKDNDIEISSAGFDIPKVEKKYVNREKCEKEIINLVNESNVVQIYGLSGIGKTQLAIKIAELQSSKFERICWINIEDQKSEEIDLTNVIILGRNKPINLEEVVRKYKTLIIIDNLNNYVTNISEKFNDILSRDSRLLITSLEKGLEDEYTYKIPYLTFKEAYKLFENDQVINTGEEVLSSFIDDIDKHPLLLRLIINLLKRSKNLKLEELKNDYKNIHKIKDRDKNNQAFFKRIVGRYVEEYEKFLSHVTTIDNVFIEKSFLRKFGIVELQELMDACILNDNNNYYYYIHQIVLSSLKELLKEKKYVDEFREVLMCYLEEKLDIRDMEYLKFLYNHINMVNRLFVKENDSYMKVLLCNVIANYKNQDKFLDEVISTINSLNLDFNRYYDVKLYIEKLEFEIRRLKKEEKNNERLEKIKDLEKILDKNVDIDNQILLLIKHHIGKLYMGLREYESAEKIFIEIIDQDKESYSSALQLCRIYKNLSKGLKGDDRKESIDKGIKYIEYILNGDNQPITVLLSTYELISKKPFCSKDVMENYINKRFERFRYILEESINNEFDQIYLVIKELAGWLSYCKPNFYKNILEHLQPPAYIKENKELVLSYGQIYAKEFIRKKYKKETLHSEFELAESYLKQYISMIDSEPEKFNYKYLIDLYIENDKFEEADELVNKIYNGEDPYHLKWKCIIFRNKDIEKAIEFIKKAIDIAEKPDNKSRYYISSLYNEYADTLFLNNDRNCLEILMKALSIKKEVNETTRGYWESKLRKWRNRFE